MTKKFTAQLQLRTSAWIILQERSSKSGPASGFGNNAYNATSRAAPMSERLCEIENYEIKTRLSSVFSRSSRNF